MTAMGGLRRALLGLAIALSACASRAQIAPTIIPHPDQPDAKIEYFAEHPDGKGPWPTVILLHGHQNQLEAIGGKAFVRWGVLDQLARQGYLAVAVSLPGYGGSSGPEDYAGPFTQHAVEAVIAALEADHQARPDRELIEGVSLGAVTAALVATRAPHLAGLVLISGLYDFPAFFAYPKSSAARMVKKVIDDQTGGGEAALKARSALPLAGRIRARTLILNGEQDDRTDPDQARNFATAIRAGGGDATAHIYPDFGHQIPVSARDAEVSTFIEKVLKR